MVNNEILIVTDNEGKGKCKVQEKKADTEQYNDICVHLWFCMIEHKEP